MLRTAAARTIMCARRRTPRVPARVCAYSVVPQRDNVTPEPKWQNALMSNHVTRCAMKSSSRARAMCR